MPKVLFHDGFGQYNAAADVGRRFTYSHPSITLVAGPRSTAKDVGHTDNFTDTPAVGMGLTPATTTQGVVAGRFKVTALGSSAKFGLFTVQEDDGTVHLTVYTKTDGSIEVCLGAFGGSVLATSAAAVVSAGNRYFIEFKFTIANSGGTVDVRVNEVSVCSNGSADTRNGGTNGRWRFVGWAHVNSIVTDVYAVDATGGHDYLGDQQTDWHAVTAAGATAGFTPSAGSNFQNVDDVPSDGDTTYNAASVIGTKDTFVFEDLKVPGAAITAVTLLLDTKKVDAGSAKLRTVFRHGATSVDHDSVLEVAPSSGGYLYLDAGPQEANPATGTIWTEAGFNAGEIGYKKTA